MHTTSLRLACLAACVLLFAACTRERETPPPTATAAVTAAAGTSESKATPAKLTPTPAAATETETPEETLTPEATSDAVIFDYTVKAGDTLATIADSFQTEIQTLRELNFLLDDNIFAGQVLTIPYTEGMTAEGAPTPTPAPFVYTVEAGDTLGSIAIQFGISSMTLVEINNIPDQNNLAIGTELLIPGRTTAATSDETATEAGATSSGSEVGVASSVSSDAVVHVVQPGETMGQIAAEYGIDSIALADANGISNGNLIRVGQKLVIPGISQRDAIEALGQRHTVASGESLSGIAAQYGVSMEAIMALNSIDDPNKVFVGQELLIPPPN